MRCISASLLALCVTACASPSPSQQQTPNPTPSKTTTADWQEGFSSATIAANDWFIAKNSDGQVTNVWGGENAAQLAATYGLQGTSQARIEKVGFKELITSIAPSAKELSKEIRTALDKAIQHTKIEVCNLDALPHSVTINLEAGFELFAGVKFGLTVGYDSEELCRDVAKTG